tara:strand:+ start:367 stop:1086 length:720 start_codon:yes stop_codon:yes gene_type:complete
MIEVKNLTKSFIYDDGKRNYIFKDLNFTIKRGESIGLLGGNGAGKSTLIRILGGIEFADSGSIKKTCSVSWPFAVASGFQGSLTASENVKFVSKIYGTHSTKEINEKIKIVREFADIGDYFDRPFKTYSSGMRGRVSFGLSLAFKFDVYLLDEVIATGDLGFREKSIKAIEELRKFSSFIIVSHNYDFLKKNIDKAYIMKNKKLIAYEDIDEAFKDVKKMLKEGNVFKSQNMLGKTRRN